MMFDEFWLCQHPCSWGVPIILNSLARAKVQSARDQLQSVTGHHCLQGMDVAILTRRHQKRCSGPVAPRDKSVIVGVYPWNYGYIMIYLA
jgi:hypothetical protein